MRPARVDVPVEAAGRDVAQRERARSRSARNCFHAQRACRAAAATLITDVFDARRRSTRAVARRRGTRPRRAPRSSATPVAWFDDERGERAVGVDRAQIDVAQYAMPRAQFVEPSTGSSTTVIAAPARSCTPDSSLTIRTGARSSTAHAAASATRSSAY